MSRRSGDSHIVPETPENAAITQHLPASTPPETAAPGAPPRPLPALAQSETAPLLLIPGASSSSGAVGAGRCQAPYRASPRLNVLKLALMGAVLCVVMVATLAIAGGGRLSSLLFSASSGSTPAASLAANSAHITENVHPIIQANVDAGYDSRQQHDAWWDSACSAASFTEIMHAWGQKDVTIGHVIDEMSAHNPPYITIWGGLMTSDAWPFIAHLHHFNADVQFHQVSYDALVHITMQQGLPVIVGVRDYTGRYYPDLSGGHFLVVVGGDQAGLRIVDSSLYRISYLPRSEFTYLWDSGSDLTVLLTPA